MKYIRLILIAVLALGMQSCAKDHSERSILYFDDVVFPLQGGTQSAGIIGFQSWMNIYVWHVWHIHSMDNGIYYYNDVLNPADHDKENGLVSSFEIDGISVIIRPNAEIEITVTPSDHPRSWDVECLGGPYDTFHFLVRQQ